MPMYVVLTFGNRRWPSQLIDQRKAMPARKKLYPSTPQMQELGRLLRQLRTECQLTQQQVADQVKVDRPMISNWELGKGNITWNMLHRLLAAYGKKLEYKAIKKTS